MARRKVRKLSKKEAKAQEKQTAENQQQTAEKEAVSREPDAVKQSVEVASVLTVREFAEQLSIPVTQVIGTLIKNGVMATINELIDFDTMVIIGDELGYEVTLKPETHSTEGKAFNQKTETMGKVKKNLKPRPPVVTVMGHVDHGKTKLLDAIRSTDVVATESGGITQHIGAYQIKVNPPAGGKKVKSKSGERTITFLDTPGHKAFSAMRAHGANITDVVILVVAANDGVKPQTIEAANHAKEANVPIVVAINKADLPDSDIEKVKRQLADIELLAEEWGGKTPIVEVSAKENKNIEELLEVVLLVADLKDLKADPTQLASGVVIESHMQAGMGPIATVLVQEGTLKIGDPVIIGDTYGKIRIMQNYLGKKIIEAGPSMPVRIAGLQDLPDFGNRFLIADSEKIAREMTKTKTIKRKVISITDISKDAKEGKLKELKIVLKADVAGSLEAIKTSLKNISSNDVKIKIIHKGVGDLSESDINMAIASEALVLGFRVKASTEVMNLARRENIKISIYEMIYQLIDDISAALSGLLEPEIVDVELGRLQILAIFKQTKNERIIGGKVTSGKFVADGQVRIVREKETIGEGKIINLQQSMKDVSEVAEGFECGLKVETQTKILVSDILECFKKEEKIRKLGQ